ncbi:MAG TPA: fused response regulator/phosphatase [Spongiibacteraceae bacterium]|nr:fused response regulator/phosphatase [Spongiibacteraceae bacterium]
MHPDLNATILIAEDSAGDRLLLKQLVRSLGYPVVEAENGQQAVDQFARHRPRLVLMDALMPNLDGFDATRRIKALAGEDLVPVIFVTSLQDAASLRRCVEAGGDDFLSKPFSAVMLAAKLNAFLRMGDMHRTVQRQRDEITLHHGRLLRDQEMAKRIYDRVAHAGCLNLPNIRHHLSPLAVFNGDVALAATGPSGNLMVLLGDFTGHGLAAAIGAMPLAQTFYGMVGKGFSLREVLVELNSKLCEILPTEVFCCACGIDIDFAQQKMQYWNGGLPDCLLYRAASGELESLASQYLPLGVRPGADNDLQVEIVNVAPEDRVYLWSDGILEAANPTGERFGETRLRAVFAGHRDRPQSLFDAINRALADHIDDQALADDLCIVEVTVVEEARFAGMAQSPSQASATAPLDWSARYEFRPDSLRVTNPLPLVLHNLLEISALRPYSGPLYTVLAELYSNALEHGVLALDSAIKATPAGFAHYYQARDQRLQNLTEGWVRIGLHCTGGDRGGELQIEVEDSGAGFDLAALTRSADVDPGRYTGRGYPLLCELCESVRYHPPGNRVVASFRWTE